jgi:hypothetical protein
MDFLAVSSSNVLKLGGCLHSSLTHNVVKPVFLIIHGTNIVCNCNQHFGQL